MFLHESEQGWSMCGMSSSMRGPLFLWISKTHFSEVLLKSKGDMLPWTVGQGWVQPWHLKGLAVFSNLVIKATLDHTMVLQLFSLFLSCVPTFAREHLRDSSSKWPTCHRLKEMLTWNKNSCQDLQGPKHKKLYSLNTLRVEAHSQLYPEPYKVLETRWYPANVEWTN